MKDTCPEGHGSRTPQGFPQDQLLILSCFLKGPGAREDLRESEIGEKNSGPLTLRTPF